MKFEMKRFGNYWVTKDGELYHHLTGRKKYTWLGQGRASVYERTQFWVDGKQKNFYIHRLMAQLYLPGWDPEFIVHHIDGNSLNNNIDNLEMGNQSYNIYEAYWKKEQMIKLGNFTTKVIMRVGTVNAVPLNHRRKEI